MNLNLETPAVFMPLLQPSRYKGAYGGRGSGKSHFFASMIIEQVLTRRVDVVCIREIQKTLTESVKKLIEDKIDQYNLHAYFDVKKTEITTRTGNKIIFIGMQDQNAANIKSLEGYGIAWFEEAQTMSFRSLELLRPTIRTPNSELWFSWNPNSEDDAVERLMRSGITLKDAIVVKANWRDNPHFPEVLEKERCMDMQLFPERYRHTWEGEFGNDGDTFFPVAKLLNNEKPVDVHWRVDQVFAVIDSASKDGAQHDGTAVAFFAKSIYEGFPLVILDWDVIKIQSNLLIEWLPHIMDRIEELARELKARQGACGAWIEDRSSGIQLLQTAEAQGIDVYPIDTKLTSSGKEGRAIACSSYIATDKVKISRYAFDKTVNYQGQVKNHFWDQISRFRMGQKKADHKKDCLDTFMYGILISLAQQT